MTRPAQPRGKTASSSPARAKTPPKPEVKADAKAVPASPRVAAVKVLKDDHKQLIERIDALAGMGERAGFEEVGELLRELTLHFITEEEIFYPAVRAVLKTKDPSLHEALAEHEMLDALVTSMRRATPGTEQFLAVVRVLGRVFTQHAAAEEAGLFRRAEEALPPARMQTLGGEIRTRRDELALEL